MKTISTLAFLLFATLSFGQIPNDSLQIYFPFSGDMKDHSINNWQSVSYKTATLTTDRFGKANSACYISNYSGGAITAQINPSVFNGKVGVSYWIKIDASYIDTGMEIFKSNCFYEHNVNMAENSEWLTFDGTKPITQVNNIPTRTGKWTNVIINYNKLNTNHTIDIYINGVFIAISGSPTYTSNTLEDFIIGGSHFTGAIDDIRFYNHTLSQNQITVLSNEKSGIETVSIPNISIYPNPAKGILHLSEPCDIKIYNLSGCVVKSCLNEQVIDVSGLKGLYMIEARNKEGVKVEKVMVD